MSRLLTKLKKPFLHQVSKFTAVMNTSTQNSLQNRIALCQMTSTDNKEKNLITCTQFIQLAAKGGAKMVFLPEACDFIASGVDVLLLSEPLNGPIMHAYKSLAKLHKIWISLGGIHERIDNNRVANTHVILNSSGEISSLYRKVHLFDVSLPNVELQESKTTTKGEEIISPVQTPIGCVGLCICYDLRFPEMGTIQRNLGADILCYPSAFTSVTGKKHWEVLLRARAIENQVYVVAAAQVGIHNDHRSSWGHSMVVDPTGNILKDLQDNVGIELVNIDLSILEHLRRSMPVFEHRRNDLYPVMLPFFQKYSIHPEKEMYQFGPVFVAHGSIFYATNLTMAFTNIRCVVPGHVLVAPFRLAERLRDLSVEEVTDLFLTVQMVEKTVEKHYGVSSSTIAVQDGPLAGQTIKHVHVHILPRRKGDFAVNDDIYRALEDHDKLDNIPERSLAEMAEEANALKRYFTIPIK